MTENRKQETEIEKKQKSLSFFKKVITILIITPFLPVILFVGLLVSGRASSDGTTVDERFALSSSMKSPYTDIVKGSYEYSFAFCGDPHMLEEGDGNFGELDSAVRSGRINFVIFGGDLTMFGKEAEYKNFINHANQLTVPSYPAIGNHDLYNNGWENYWRSLGPSVYSFCGGNAKFVVIDTASGEIGQKQMEWIRKELKENKQPLTFVVTHVPIYGGSHGICEFPKSQERQELIDLFEKYEVDYVLEGHYHGYVYISSNGVRYITSGSFSEGLLDSGQRHFLVFRIYGPNVSVEKVLIEAGEPVQYRDGQI